MIKKYNSILIYPKVGDEDYAQPLMPLSVLAPATAAQNAGYSIKIIDQRISKNWREEVKNSINDHLLCFGISSMTGPQLGFAIEIAEYLKNNFSEIPIVWGGVHASLLPKQTLNSGLADIIVEKEGEITFVELLNVMKLGYELDNVNGISYWNANGNIIKTQEREFCNLDEYAYLDFSLIDMSQYQIQGTDRAIRKNSVSLYTSRGCPAGCTYCYNCIYHQRKWRGQCAEVAFTNIKRLCEYGISNIIVCDEYFFHNIDRARSISKKLIDGGINIKFYYVNCKISQIAKMTDDDLILFSNAGINDLFVGIETGSKRMQNKIKKYVKLEEIIPVAKRLQLFGISTQFSFLLGLPDENIKDMKDTIKLMVNILKEVPETIMCGAGKFIPFPGTEAYDQVCNAGWIPPKDLKEWSKITFNNDVTWLKPEIRKIIDPLLYLTYVLDTKINPRKNVVLELIRKIYSKIVTWRCRHGFINIIPEYCIIKSPLMALFQKKKK